MGRNYSVSAKIKGKDEASSVFRRVGRGLKQHLGGPIHGINRGITGIRRGFQAVPGVALVGGGLIDAGRSLIELATGVAKTGDEIAKTARRAGISTNALQSLGYAAQIAGASQDQFNSGVKMFARNMGFLQAKTGPLYSLLKKVAPEMIGLLQGAKDNESALRMVFSALGKLEDPTRRAALAMAAFGRNGENLSLIAEQGDEGLAKLEERFRRFGFALDDKFLSQAEEAQDQLLDFSVAWQGLKNVVGAQILQAGLPKLRELVQWIADNPDSIKKWATEFATGFVGALEKGVKVIDDLITGISDMIGWLKKIPGWVDEVEGDVGGGMVDVFKAVNDTLIKPRTSSANTVEQFAGLLPAAGGLPATAHSWLADAAARRAEALRAAGNLAGAAGGMPTAGHAAGLITVRFEGAPPGTRVDIQRGSKGVKTDVGRRPVVP